MKISVGIYDENSGKDNHKCRGKDSRTKTLVSFKRFDKRRPSSCEKNCNVISGAIIKFPGVEYKVDSFFRGFSSFMTTIFVSQFPTPEIVLLSHLSTLPVK